MAKVVVRLRGEQVAELTLEPGQEYLAGRGADAHVRLNEERGISRHHLKFVEHEGRWVVQALSKFLLMQKGGETLEVIELGPEATGFTVPPYEFSFEPDPGAAAVAEPAAEGANLPGVYVPRVTARRDAADQDVTRTRANNEATVAGRQALTPFLKIKYPDAQSDEVFKLEGQLWTAGRDPACEISVDSPLISRRHFELSRTEGGFFVTDLGSANGTKLNNVRLVAHEPTKLESGDEVRVQSIEMLFEIRDVGFANRLGNLPVVAVDPLLQNALAPWAANEVAMPATEYHRTPAYALPKPKFDVKKLVIRGVIGLLALVMVALSLMPDKKKPVNDNADGSKPAVWDGLSAEKKNIIKDSFALARNLYVQGKYALCQTELRKVHDLIPQYENSKELESFCEQGLELVRRQEDLDRQAREKAAIEQKITGYVDDCKAKLTPQSTVDETRVCLAPAIEMAPEHALVVEMLHSAEMHEEERKFLAKQRAAEDAEVAKGQRAYDRCEDVYKTGNLPKAIDAFRRFLTMRYPKSEGLKDRARRQLASIEKELAQRVGGFLAQCKDLGEKNQYKDAWYACDKALKEDKTSKEAKDVRERMHTRLRKDMRAIYEDSVLEESMGNVDTAKEKWKKIVAEDIEADDYFTKAKSKLQKYLGD